MRIGGLVKVTLLDFPGRVAASIFTVGCSFACRFCYNPHLVLGELIKNTPILPENEVWDFLTTHQKYLDGVCISCGEPTLQPDLITFCQRLKTMGYAIKLDTNGYQPAIVKKLIDKKLVDYIAMDIKAPLVKYPQIVGREANQWQGQNITKTIKLLLAWQNQRPEIVVEFRSTLVPGLHTLAWVRQMAKLITGAPIYYLQNFILPGPLVDKDFRPNRSFTKSELQAFCQAAKQYVKNCQLRLNIDSDSANNI